MIVNRFVFAGTVLLVAWAALVMGNNLGGPSTGGVRFNAAGNAANGLNDSSGDFIYSTAATVSPATETDNSVRTYSIADKGGLSLITSSGSLPNPLVAYTKIQPDVGSTTPSGVGIFGLRQNGTVVSETEIGRASCRERV